MTANPSKWLRPNLYHVPDFTMQSTGGDGLISCFGFIMCLIQDASKLLQPCFFGHSKHIYK